MKNLRKLLTIITTLNFISLSTMEIMACSSSKNPTPAATIIDISNKIPSAINLSQLDIDNSKSSFLNALQAQLITIQDLNNITIADYDVYQAGTTNDIEDDMIINTNWLAIKIVAKGDSFTGIKDNITTEYTRNISQQDTIYLDKDGNQQTTATTDLSTLDVAEIIQIGFYQNNNGKIQVVRMPKTVTKVPTQLPLEITVLQNMFNGASDFNQDLANWNVSHVTDMWRMFTDASDFNQDVSSWNTSNVTSMAYMFSNASSFNQNIANWNVANVTQMQALFSGASAFNQDIANWNVANVTNMNSMFANASAFNQDLSNWNVANVKSHSAFADNSGFADDTSKWPTFPT